VSQVMAPYWPTTAIQLCRRHEITSLSHNGAPGLRSHMKSAKQQINIQANEGRWTQF